MSKPPMTAFVAGLADPRGRLDMRPGAFPNSSSSAKSHNPKNSLSEYDR